MLFAVDIGNTNVTIGVFEKENIVTSFRLNTDTNRFAEEYLLSINSLLSLRNITPNNIDSCVICSVVPPLNPIFTLANKKYIPLDITLSPNDKTIVISGPNSGGKTIVIKSIGLYSVMAQCGLFVPALNNVGVAWVNIFFDIYS